MAMDIAGALATLTAAIGLAKELRDIDHQFDKAELRLKIVEMTDALATAKAALVEAEGVIRDKDEEVSRLRSELALKATQLVDRGQFRFFADEAGNPKGRPICPKCEKRGDYLEVVQDRTKGAGRITYYCPGCKANYGPHVPRA
jgi:hypothetical protein